MVSTEMMQQQWPTFRTNSALSYGPQLYVDRRVQFNRGKNRTSRGFSTLIQKHIPCQPVLRCGTETSMKEVVIFVTCLMMQYTMLCFMSSRILVVIVLGMV